MIKRIIVAASLFAAVALTSTGSTSCGSGGGTGGSGGGTGGGTGTGGGAADPELTCDATPPATSFAKVYTDVFEVSCKTCHKPGLADQSGSYGDYTTEALAYAQVGKTSLYKSATKEPDLKVVTASNLSLSSMYLKCIGRTKSPGGAGIGGPMPLTGTALTATQKKLLKDWICSGAKP